MATTRALTPVVNARIILANIHWRAASRNYPILFGLAIWLSRLTAVRQYDFVINFSPPRAIARGSVNGSSLASSAQKYNKKNNRQERRIINNTPQRINLCLTPVESDSSKKDLSMSLAPPVPA
jgi:hypothetical protein